MLMLTMLRSFQTRTSRRILGIEISGPPAKAPMRNLHVRRLLVGAAFPCRHQRAIPIKRGLAESLLFAKSTVRMLGAVRSVAVAELSQKSLCTAIHVKPGVEFDSLVRVSLVDMYVKFDFMSFGWQLFVENPFTDKNATVFWRMLEAVKSVVGLSQKSLGAAVHGKIVKSGVEFDSKVRASLANMYVKLDLLSSGLQLFDESPKRMKNGSVHLWYAVIRGCCMSGILDKAVGLFEEMPERNIGSWNSLIYGFMQNDEADKAMELFKRMGEKNVVTWTTMVHGLCRKGMHEKALETFFMMVGGKEGAMLNDIILASVLCSCAELGAFRDGTRILDYAIRLNGFRMNAVGVAAMVHMFAKCGSIELAQQVFTCAIERDARTWSTMIHAFAVHGNAEDALECFQGMKLAGMEPDELAFLGALIACSRAGEVDKGIKLFQSMRLDYCIQPTMKHYAAVVDLYGRSGQLDEALRFIQSMEPSPDSIIWATLFTACQAHKNTEMTEFVAKQLLKLDPNHPGVLS